MIVMAVLLSRVGFLFPKFVKAFGRPNGIVEVTIEVSY
jgi:hypothetical protein